MVRQPLLRLTAADNIAVLSVSGTVEVSGTHADLMAADGQYADFWAQRVSATDWEVVTRLTPTKAATQE